MNIVVTNDADRTIKVGDIVMNENKDTIAICSAIYHMQGTMDIFIIDTAPENLDRYKLVKVPIDEWNVFIGNINISND